jgi:hypothetical protein
MQAFAVSPHARQLPCKATNLRGETGHSIISIAPVTEPIHPQRNRLFQKRSFQYLDKQTRLGSSLGFKKQAHTHQREKAAQDSRDCGTKWIKIRALHCVIDEEPVGLDKLDETGRGKTSHAGGRGLRSRSAEGQATKPLDCAAKPDWEHRSGQTLAASRSWISPRESKTLPWRR